MEKDEKVSVKKKETEGKEGAARTKEKNQEKSRNMKKGGERERKRSRSKCAEASMKEHYCS